MIVGQCPGPQEKEQQRIFVGPSGKKLDAALAASGISRRDVYITNAVKGYVPPGNTVSKTFVRLCSEHLMGEIEMVKPSVIICLGSTAASALGYKLIANSYFFDDKLNCFVVLTHHPAKLLRTYDDKVHQEFQQAFSLALTMLSKNKQTPSLDVIAYSGDVSVNDLRVLGDTVALDLETSGLNFIQDEIVSIGLSDGVTTIGIQLYDNQHRSKVVNVLKSWLPTRRIVGHNIKFDYKFLKKVGITIYPFFDTMLAHFLIDREAHHGLSEIALKYLHTNLSKGSIDFDRDFKEGTINPIKYTQYVAHDAWLTYQVYTKLKSTIDREFNFVFYKIMIPTLEWLANAEYRGVKIDRQYIQQYLHTAEYRLKSLEIDIQQDPTIVEFCKKYNLESFNVRSPKQLSDLLYKYLKLNSKVKKTGEEILEELSNKYPHLTFLTKIADYRHLYKSYRTYLQNLLKFSALDGRVHCHYNQCRVPSGRLSSSSPNLQNIPKSDTDNPVKQEQATIIRRSFISDDDYVLIEADFSQAEFRALAHYSRDPHMIQMINEGRDIHRMIASVAYMKREEDVTDAERKIAKTIVFGIMYGRGAKSIAEALQISVKEAENIRNTFLGTFRNAAAWINNVQKFAKRHGYVRTLTGRKITLPAIYSKDKEQVAYALRCAINYPIQGLVGDMTNLAGSLLYKEFRDKQLDAHLIMNIHDSLIIECHRSVTDTVKQIIKKVMEVDTKNMLGLRVNIKVDIKEGTNLSFQ